MKNSEAIAQVIDYIYHAEFGGKIDKTDPWYGTYEELKELKEKALDDEDAS